MSSATVGLDWLTAKPCYFAGHLDDIFITTPQLGMHCFFSHIVNPIAFTTLKYL